LIQRLEQHYNSKIYREWMISKEKPHFSDHRSGMFKFACSDACPTSYGLSRAFFSAEVIRQGDKLLDIGCGDGFITRRFLAERCAHVDAVDIEPTAIRAAMIYNKASNIAYHLLNAVSQPFPGNDYNVVVWDGAIGHFSSDTTNVMLRKIRHALVSDGIFVGSESLGTQEGHDHLQFFNSSEDLKVIFECYFKYIEMKIVAYPICNGAIIRQEAMWRCSDNLQRLQESHWKRFYK